MSLPPILCYHKVDARREPGATRVSPAVFRRQMETLARAGFRTLGSAELEGLVATPPAGRPAPGTTGADRRGPAPATPHSSPLTPRPSLVLTFDDGYAGLAEHAFPVLADLGLTALVFVITDYVGRENRWDVALGWRRFPHLGWDELARWRERGVVEVHSHGATHARLTWLSDAQVEDELGRSREAIARRLGATPAGIAYPFGAVDGRVRALAEAAGYTLGFAGARRPGGARAEAHQRLVLPRRSVYAWDVCVPPCVLREDAAGALAMAVAWFTQRFSVGTSVIRRIGRVRALRRP